MSPTSSPRRPASSAGAHRAQAGRSRRWLWLGLAACALVTSLTYLPAFRFGLVWDDAELARNAPAAPLQAFTRSFWPNPAGLVSKDVYYRPLVNSTLSVDRLLGRGSASLFHAANLMLHVLVTMLFALLVWRLWRSVGAAVACGLIFGLHPMAADSVAYVSGRTDVLAAAGLVVALHGLVGWQREQRWRNAAAVWSGYAIGILSKETAVLFLLVAAVWLLAARGWRRLSRRDLLLLGGIIVLAAGYAIARRAVLGSIVGMNLAGAVSRGVVLAFVSFGRSLVDFAAPFYRRVFVWDSASPRVAAYGIATLAYLLLPFVLRRTKHGAAPALGWLWGLVFLLPVAGLASFGPVGRLLYIPAFGFVLIGAAVAQGLAKTRPAVGPVAFGLALALAAAFVPAVLARQQVWRDELTLFQRMVREAPDNPLAHFNLAMELRDRGDTAGAIAEYRRTLQLDPQIGRAYANLAVMLQARGQLDSAIALYREAAVRSPGYAPAHTNLGLALFQRGDTWAGISATRRALEVAPGDAGAAYNLGLMYRRAGQPDSARHFLGLACRLDPGNPRYRAAYERPQP